MPVVSLAEWNPADHPRAPKGTKGGGRFVKDPIIDVGDNVDAAVGLLAEGRRVQLRQPHQVSTLIERLADVVKECDKKGTKAPNFDLCRVSVKGTNLFCAKHKGIARVKMPQLKGEPLAGTKADALPRDVRNEVDL